MPLSKNISASSTRAITRGKPWVFIEITFEVSGWEEGERACSVAQAREVEDQHLGIDAVVDHEFGLAVELGRVAGGQRVPLTCTLPRTTCT